MTVDPVIEVMTRHFRASEEEAWDWSDYVAKRTFGEPEPFFDRKRDVENLEKLDRALGAAASALEFEAMTRLAQEFLRFRIVRDRSFDGLRVADAIDVLEDNISAIRRAIRHAIQHIECSPRSRTGATRINVDGIKLVEAARNVWRFATGKEAAAKALNPASPFGNFLSDLFEAFGVEGDPRSAFRAWAKLNEP